MSSLSSATSARTVTPSSVTDEGVTVLAEVAELSGDIDTARAQAALERARSEQDVAAQRRAESRLRAAGSAR